MSSRGDRKPCSAAQCTGTMQFGRAPIPTASGGFAAAGERAWICSDDASHVRLASDLPERGGDAGAHPERILRPS